MQVPEFPDCRGLSSFGRRHDKQCVRGRTDLRQLDAGAGIPEPGGDAGLFRIIERDTNGAIKWKLIAGGQIADGKTTFTAVKDGLMQAGLGIVTYVPNALPSVYAIYCTIVFGENDPVAATLAALETIYLHCPSCLEEAKKYNAVLVGGWTSSAYMLACREPLRTMADLKGKRVRATGGNAEMLKMAGMVPVGATLVEAVGLLQRGGLDCQHGIHRLAAHLRLWRRREVRHGLLRSASPGRRSASS